MTLPLEKLVVSLETAKELKRIGFPQESLFYYAIGESDKKRYLVQGKPTTDTMLELKESIGKQHYIQYVKSYYAAPTASEIGEWFHKSFNEWAQGWNDSGCFYHFTFGNRGSGSMIEGIGKTFNADIDDENYFDNEAEARARFLIYLVDKGLVNFK